jgi:peptidoglycan/xylan/chitin deacetylase (PgdA/CDA1 family)
VCAPEDLPAYANRMTKPDRRPSRDPAHPGDLPLYLLRGTLLLIRPAASRRLGHALASRGREDEGVTGALLVAYHDISDGRAPLAIAPALFEEHLDSLVDSGATTLTVSSLAAALRSGRVPERAVCLTFDDGYGSVAATAGPLLAERGLVATVYCVAGYLGRVNDWPSQPGWVERRPLASARALEELARSGFEIGAHGYHHQPLANAPDEDVRREVVTSRVMLADAIGVPVETFAYPYGLLPTSGVPTTVRAVYRAACTATPRRAGLSDDLLRLPRVDAHYIRRPALFRRTVLGHAEAYLAVRRTGRSVRNRVRLQLVPR